MSNPSEPSSKPADTKPAAAAAEATSADKAKPGKAKEIARGKTTRVMESATRRWKEPIK